MPVIFLFPLFAWFAALIIIWLELWTVRDIGPFSCTFVDLTLYIDTAR